MIFEQFSYSCPGNHIAFRSATQVDGWLQPPCHGTPGIFENTCSMSPSKSFSTCVRYIICFWLWASCHLPPIKTPRATLHRSASKTRSCPELGAPDSLDCFHTLSSELRPVSPCGLADTESAVGRTAPR